LPPNVHAQVCPDQTQKYDFARQVVLNIGRQIPLNGFQLLDSRKGRSFFTALWNFEVASPAFAMIHYRGANLAAAQIPT